eukprot:scaffold117685_cov51-Prasinocladus_malaysianus.AAC.1
MEAGLDSLAVVELRNEMETRFGMRFPATLVLDHPSIARMTDLVLQDRQYVGETMTNNDYGSVQPSTCEATMTEVRSMVRMIIGNGACEDSTPLMEAGIDSLGAVELKSMIQNRFCVELPSTIVFDYPTIHDLGLYLERVALVDGKFNDVMLGKTDSGY